MRGSAAHGSDTLAPALGAVNDQEPTCGTPPLKRLVAARFRSDHDECGCTRPGLIVGTEEPCPPYGSARSPRFIPARVTTRRVRGVGRGRDTPAHTSRRAVLCHLDHLFTGRPELAPRPS